jgi:hypothetical protein
VRLPHELNGLECEVPAGSTWFRTLALGDACRGWNNPERLLGGVKLKRLELIGGDFESIPQRAIEMWSEAEGFVLSANFAGQKNQNHSLGTSRMIALKFLVSELMK